MQVDLNSVHIVLLFLLLLVDYACILHDPLNDSPLFNEAPRHLFQVVDVPQVKTPKKLLLQEAVLYLQIKLHLPLGLWLVDDKFERIYLIDTQLSCAVALFTREGTVDRDRHHD